MRRLQGSGWTGRSGALVLEAQIRRMTAELTGHIRSSKRKRSHLSEETGCVFKVSSVGQVMEAGISCIYLPRLLMDRTRSLGVQMMPMDLEVSEWMPGDAPHCLAIKRHCKFLMITDNLSQRLNMSVNVCKKMNKKSTKYRKKSKVCVCLECRVDIELYLKFGVVIYTVGGDL